MPLLLSLQLSPITSHVASALTLSGGHSASCPGSSRPPSSGGRCHLSIPWPRFLGAPSFLSPNRGGSGPSHLHRPHAGTQMSIRLRSSPDCLPSFKLECPLGNHRHLKFSMPERKLISPPPNMHLPPSHPRAVDRPTVRPLTQDRNLGICLILRPAHPGPSSFMRTNAYTWPIFAHSLLSPSPSSPSLFPNEYV